jgi:hypothetical protein
MVHDVREGVLAILRPLTTQTVVPMAAIRPASSAPTPIARHLDDEAVLVPERGSVSDVVLLTTTTSSTCLRSARR